MCYWPGGGKEGQFSPGFGRRVELEAQLLIHTKEVLDKDSLQMLPKQRMRMMNNLLP